MEFERGTPLLGGGIAGTGICEGCRWREETTALTAVCEHPIMRKRLIQRAIEVEKNIKETVKPLSIVWAFDIAMTELVDCDYREEKSWWKQLFRKA